MNIQRKVFLNGVAACAAMAGCFVPRPLHADSSVIGYGQPGNELNPNGQLMDLQRDPNGLSLLDEITRTPTGLLYPLPFVNPNLIQAGTGSDWWTSAWINAGGIFSFGPGRKSSSFQEYGDWVNGLILGSAGFYAENRKSGWYVSGLAEDAGRRDQFYQLTGGLYGVLNAKLFFDEIPHVYSTEARSIWAGIGTGNLVLRDGLVPGASSAAAVAAAAAGAPLTEIKITRQKAGFSLSYTPEDDLEAYLQLSNEERQGTQPISATFGYPFENGATQIIEPIHYNTFDVTAVLRYKEQAIQANLTYSGSFFHNSDLALDWQNPGLAQVAAGSYIPPEGQLSLPPANSYNTLKGDASATLSPSMRFSGSLSYSEMRQNDALLPPTIDSGIIPGAGGPINLANWNTTAALNQLHANAAINLFNAFAQFHYVVSPDIGLDVELRDHNEDNRTNYLSFNPQTGQYGYIAIDGGLAPFEPALSGVYQPNAKGSVVQIRNMPFANDNLEVTARGSYRLDTHLKLDLSYVHNSIEHTVRALPNADDNRVRLQIASTGFEWGTIRLSYEFGHLSGSDYTSNPYTPYYSTSLPGYVPLSPAGDIPFTLANLRQFDIGNRVEHIFHAQSNYIVSPRIDAQLTGNFKIDDYAAHYGLRYSSSYDVNLDVNYQVSVVSTLTGFVTVQMQRKSIANINSIGQPGSALAGGPDYPLANAWSEGVGNHDIAAGITGHRSWGDLSLDGSYVYSHGDSAIAYAYASTGAFFNLLTAAQAGNSFPDITFDSHLLQAGLRWQAGRNLSYHLIYRFAYQKTDDFHYNNLTGVISNNTYLGVVPENFTVQTIGIMAQYVFGS